MDPQAPLRINHNVPKGRLPRESDTTLIRVTKRDVTDGELRIRDGITKIGEYAACQKTYIFRVVIPGSVTDILEGAFDECINLIKVVISEGVTYIEHNVFSNCINLESVVIPSSVTDLDDFLFEHCHKLRDIEIPASITQIGNNVFSHCYSLTRVVIPENVTEIGSSVFAHCRNLREIVIQGSISEICEHTFSGCQNLRHIVIPVGVTEIAKTAFIDCENLEFICVDSDDDDELARIKRLLPKNLKVNVVSWSIHRRVLQAKQEAFHTVNSNPKTHQWYHAANNTKCRLIEDVLPIFNEFCPENRYFRETKNAIEQLAYPRSEAELKLYISRCRAIATHYSNLANWHKHPPGSVESKQRLWWSEKSMRTHLYAAYRANTMARGSLLPRADSCGARPLLAASPPAKPAKRMASCA